MKPPITEPAIKKQILADLSRLPPEQQRRAAELVRGMTSSLPPGVPGRDLLQFASSLHADAAREMRQVIEEGCGQVDLDRG